MVIFISKFFYNSMEDWCADQNLFSSLKSLIKAWVHDVYPQFGGDGYFHLRWQLFFCMRTCDIFSLREWFLTFFVHTDFYSFTACKRAEIEVGISPKRWSKSSWNLVSRCTKVIWTIPQSFSPNQFLFCEILAQEV